MKRRAKRQMRPSRGAIWKRLMRKRVEEDVILSESKRAAK
jgi:hypothetical protein